MSDATFRAPVEATATPAAPPPEPQNPDVPTGDPEVPIALHEEINGRPYSADYFGMSEIWGDHESLSGDLQAIDSYYRNQVASGALKDGIESFKALIKDAEKLTGTKNAGDNLKVAKIAEYVKFMQRMNKLESDAKRWR